MLTFLETRSSILALVRSELEQLLPSLIAFEVEHVRSEFDQMMPLRNSLVQGRHCPFPSLYSLAINSTRFLPCYHFIRSFVYSS